MFGQGSTFMGLNGAGGQVKLAQAPSYPPAPAAAPTPAPAPAVVPAGPPLPVLAEPVTSGLSHGAQVAIGATILGLTLLGAIFLTE